MPARIVITSADSDATRIYRVTGDIDLATAPDLEAALDTTGVEVVVLDLTEVGFIDSTGLRSIIAAHESAETQGAQLRLVAGDKVDRLLQITGLVDRLHVFDSLVDAGVDA